MLKTKSIKLSYINEKDELLDITLPITSVYVLEIEDITTTIGHNKDMEVLEFLKCGCLNLKLYKKKVDSKLISILEKYMILSITLNFDDDTTKSYNVPWYYSSDNIKNALQMISVDKDIINILIDKRYEKLEIKRKNY